MICHSYPKEDTWYSSQDSIFVSSPLRTGNGKRTKVDDQWHELQWQHDQWRFDLKGTIVVKTWSQQGTLLVNSSFEHKNYHHLKRLLLQLSASTSTVDSLGDIMVGPPAKGTRFLVTVLRRPFKCLSVSTPVEITSFSENSGAHSALPAKKLEINHWSI